MTDPQGPARRNSRIGKRGGRVLEIHRDCVTVIERAERLDVCLEPRAPQSIVTWQRSRPPFGPRVQPVPAAEQSALPQ